VLVKFFLLLTFLGCGMNLSGHPLHLTFTNLELNELTGQWEVAIKIFSNDLEADVLKATGVKLDMKSDHPDAATFEAINNWLEEGLKITFNHTTLPLSKWTRTGWETKEDAVRIRFTLPYNREVKRVEVKNTILFDLFTDQKNLLIFTKGKIQKSYQFRKGKPVIVINL